MIPAMSRPRMARRRPSLPDDHPDMTIDGMIVAKPGSEIVRVILRGIPVHDQTDRTVNYCRFEAPGTET
jgi:hypothetical protein